jgi:hypothetical protein
VLGVFGGWCIEVCVLGRVSFSGDGVAGPEKIVGGYYRGCPAPGESEWAPHFPPDEDGVLAVCTRVIGWLLQVNSQVTCQSSAIHTRIHTYSCGYNYVIPTTGYSTAQPYHVVRALLSPVGPVNTLRRLTKQALLASTSEIVPTVTKLNTASTRLAFADDFSFRCVARWLDR